MAALDHLEVAVFAFGTLVLGALALLAFEERRDRPPPSRWDRALLWYSALWFAQCLLDSLELPGPTAWRRGLDGVGLSMTLLWPPLIVEVVQHERPPRTRPGVHRALAMLLWIGAVTLAGISTLVLMGSVAMGLDFLSLTITGAFVLVAVYSSWHLRGPRMPESTAERGYRTGTIVLFGALAAVFAGAFLLAESDVAERLLGLAAKSFPLLFAGVAVFHLRRFVFLDAFVKRGLFAFLTAAGLALFFAAAAPRLADPGLGWRRPWLGALGLLPLALALPWLYRRLERWLDRTWLGRSLSPVEAVQRFLTDLEVATSSDEMLERARSSLSEIFGAPVEIRVARTASRESAFDPALSVPLRVEGTGPGEIRLGTRRNALPFFREDVLLATTLSGVLAHLLENAGLQRRRHEQESRERDLQVLATRAELRALRAQINPHFLFNALNAVAALIQTHPARAEETVEQLSEVFRYTLRSAQREWARLSEEMDLARAYLEVERARFGSRFHFALDLEENLGDVLVPAMMVQTLVENAVKHGASAIRGPASVAVRARSEDASLLIEVEDNGPGFQDRPEVAEGHGLGNLRARLAGYYGAAGRLVVSRREGVTFVRLFFPAERASS